MFCEKCGSFVEGDGTLCSRCAAEQAAQAENTVENAAPTGDTFELNTAEPTKAKKAPKKKRGLIAAIVATSIVATGALGAFFCRDYIKGFYDRTFKKPEKYFVDVQKDAVAKYSDELTQGYGKLLDQYSDPESTDISGYEAEIKLAVGDEVLSLLESTLSQQGMDMDISWLQDIRLSMSTNMQDSVVQMILSAGLGRNKVLSADMIVDSENGKVYAAVPELNKDYLYVDASGMYSVEDMQAAIAESNEMANKLAQILPSEEVLNDLINTYVDIALSSINDVEKETQTIDVGDASQKMVVLTAEISEADLIEMAQAILEEARDDKNLEKVLVDLAEFYNENSYEELDLAYDFKASIDEALEDLEESKEYADDDNYIELKTYVDMKSNLRGYEVCVYGDGEPMSDTISWLTAVSGKTTYTEAELGEVAITGEKTESKSGSEGYYEVSVNRSEILTVEFEIVNDTTTTLRFMPGDDLMDELLSDTGLPSAMMSGKAALELSYGTDEDGKSFCQLSVLMGSKMLVSVNLSAKAIKGGNITIPTNVVDALSADGAQQWLANIDFEALFTNLENAGIPQMLVDELRSYTSLLDYMV